MKKFIAKIALTALLVLPFSVALPVVAETSPNWNTTGSYVLNVNFESADYAHDMNLVQDGMGNLTGNGGSPSGANTYTWVITDGSVHGDMINFHANYTATEDAVVPQTVFHVMGTISSEGTMSGTWTDNYQGSERSGTWSTTSGKASVLPGALSAEDFGVMDSSGVKGYTAGFGLTDATFAGVQSVIMKLYSGDTLLQTNTATSKVGVDITGTQISSPFDVFGTFDYTADGYWVNVKGSEYGQTLIPTKVVANVILANGKVVTAENTNLTGDTTTIFDGTISGTVTGGAPFENGVLKVTGVTSEKTTAIADGTFVNGWKYKFSITVPSNEPNLSMKFADWSSVVGSSILEVANNMRISSLQADNSGATIILTGSNVYSSPTLNMTGDLDLGTAGKQVEVTVEVAVPSTTVNGGYTTSYGVKSE